MLNSVHEDDSGTYTCKLSTAKGQSQIPCCFRDDNESKVLLTEMCVHRGADLDCEPESDSIQGASVHS